MAFSYVRGRFLAKDRKSDKVRKANSTVWFGMNTFLSLGEADNIAGTSYFGTPSMTMDMRKDGLYSGSSLEGWKADYDDFANDKHLVNSMYLTLNFTPALSLKSTVGVDYENNERHFWYGEGTAFGAENNGVASLLASSVFKYNASSVLTYKTAFGDNTLNAQAGVDASGENTAFNVENGADYFNHLLRSKGLNLAASKAIINKRIHNYSTAGGFVRGAYGFGKIAGADLTLRLDKTGRYDDKLNLYKSANVWADLSESVPFSTLKLTAGYGEGGKEMYVPYGLYGNYLSAGTVPAVGEGLEMFYEGLNRLTSREFNVGVDLGFMDNALKAHVGYYSKKTDDAFNGYCFGKQYKETIYWEIVDRQDDFTRTTTIANSGFEFDLSWDIINNSDYKWNAYANAAYNVNSLVAVDAEDASGLSVGSGLIPNANIEGSPVGAICDASGNVLGNPVPKVSYAVGSNFACGPVKVDVLFNGASGFDILNLNEMALKGATAVSSDFVESGSYLKLSRVAASYKLPLDSVKWIRSAEVVLSGLNLITLSDYSGWNPEVNSFGKSGYTNGLDYGSYPAFSSFVLGIRLNF